MLEFLIDEAIEKYPLVEMRSEPMLKIANIIAEAYSQVEKNIGTSLKLIKRV